MPYIETETLKQYMKLQSGDWGTPDERWVPEREIGAFIDTCPQVDAVEVVRCKDCEEYDEKLCFCDLHRELRHSRYFCGSARKGGKK